MMMRVYLVCVAVRPGRLPPGVTGAVFGEVGAGPLLVMQHLKSLGPGQSPVSVTPVLQPDVQRQSPRSVSVPQVGFVQHLMSAAVPGQAFEMKLPPPEVHCEVGMHTPGAPASPVQGPLTAARVTRAATWEVPVARTMSEMVVRSCILRKRNSTV